MCVDVWNRRHTISFSCVKTLKKLKTQILTVRSLKGNYFLQHDSARPHVSILTRKAIAECGWTFVPYVLYGPSFVPSDFM